MLKKLPIYLLNIIMMSSVCAMDDREDIIESLEKKPTSKKEEKVFFNYGNIFGNPTKKDCKTQTSDKPAIVKLEKKPTPTKEKTTSFNYANIFGSPNKKVPSKQPSNEDIILKIAKGEKLSDNEDKLFNNIVENQKKEMGSSKIPHKVPMSNQKPYTQKAQEMLKFGEKYMISKTVLEKIFPGYIEKEKKIIEEEQQFIKECSTLKILLEPEERTWCFAFHTPEDPKSVAVAVLPTHHESYKAFGILLAHSRATPLDILGGTTLTGDESLIAVLENIANKGVSHDYKLKKIHFVSKMRLDTYIQMQDYTCGDIPFSDFPLNSPQLNEYFLNNFFNFNGLRMEKGPLAKLFEEITKESSQNEEVSKGNK